MQRNLSAIRHVRENARWLKIAESQRLRGGERKTSFAGSSLVLSISPRSKRISHIWKYSREAGDQRQDLDYLSEGTARTRDSHKTDFRTPWVPIVAVDRQPDRTWKMHQGGVVPIYWRRDAAKLRNVCGMRNARRSASFQPVNMSLRDRGYETRPDETIEIKREREIALDNYPLVL